MPNNANARREKDKKRKGKERKTVPPSLPQEDKTSADISSLSLAAEDKTGMDSSSSLSLAGTREVLEGETFEQETLGTTTSWFLSQEERLAKIGQLRRGNPGASEEEIRTLYRAYLSSETLKEQDLEVERRAAKRTQAKRDATSVDGPSHSLSPGGKETAVDPSDPKYLERVLLLEHAGDLSMEDRSIMRAKIRSEIRKSNPGLSKEDDKFKSLMHEGMVEAALEARKRRSQSTKDSSLSLLPLGTARKAASFSACAEPKVDVPLRWFPSSSSLTAEEKTIILSAVSIEIDAGTPNTDSRVLHEKYRIALWEAEVRKNGGKPGTNLGKVDLTSPSTTNDEEDRGEDSDSSDDNMKAIRDDLARQRQVSSPSSPKENRFLAGFMKPSERHQQDVQAEKALDKDPISFISPLDQAAKDLALNEQGQRTGCISGHGGSMSVQHGSVPLDPSDDILEKDRRFATEVIRNGTSLSSSQAPLKARNNFVAPSQVDSNGKEEQANLAVPASINVIGQPVLGMTFCINRRKDIVRLAGNSVLTSEYHDLQREPLLKKFRRENNSGDPPYYCVSADILGRAIHTFQSEYVTEGQEQRFSEEFDRHVEKLVAEAKESMSKDAVAIRMRNRNLIDQQHRLREEARIQCEKALEDANRRMKEASEAYGVALELQLKSLEESTITEETLLDEMLLASQSHRDRIRMATAIPPLALDADMLQWQTKCAAAEEKAEDLQRQLQELLKPDAEDLERKVERLQKENEVLQRRNLQKQRVLDARWKALSDAKVEKSVMQRELDGVNKTLNQINRLNSTLTQWVE